MRSLLFGFCLLIASGNALAAATVKSAVDDANIALELARKGEYGRLSSAQINMLTESKNRLEKLAESNALISDLDQDEKEIFDAAQGRIDRLTRSNNKDRMVCKKVVKTGTRLVESECLTVAQREARARGSRERTDQLQRFGCNSVDSQCGGGG